MVFWFIMMFFNLLIPFTLIMFGKFFIQKSPKDINGVFGYRTPMSMKNKETWAFAHNFCGKLWYKLGWAMLVVTIVAMLFVLGRDIDTVGYFGGILCMIQMGFLIATIFPTEIALKKNFDKRGHRKK